MSERYPLLTRDPVTGEELTVTRLENRKRGLVIEAEFSLGWLVLLTPEQFEFVGLFLRYRGNVQKLASEMGVAYNTARSRLDAIVEALEGANTTTSNMSTPASSHSVTVTTTSAPALIDTASILAQLENAEVDVATALALLKKSP
jgi:hypothetical protein